METPILIDLWTVDPERRDELVARISEALQAIVVGRPGFVSAEIYESVDRGIVMSSIRMRTARERQELMDSPEAHRAMRELREVAHTHAHLFRLAQTFGPRE
jgi:hypothetical protein